MNDITQRILNWLISVDQFTYNTLTLGRSSPDETLSAACWRWERAGILRGRILRPLIDRIFWFDPQHCKTSYESELSRAHLPLEYR